MPVGRCSGASYVAGLPMDAGSKTVMSAKKPGLRNPRPRIPNLSAGLPVILRTASASVVHFRSRQKVPSHDGEWVRERRAQVLLALVEAEHVDRAALLDQKIKHGVYRLAASQGGEFLQ